MIWITLNYLKILTLNFYPFYNDNSTSLCNNFHSSICIISIIAACTITKPLHHLRLVEEPILSPTDVTQLRLQHGVLTSHSKTI